MTPRRVAWKRASQRGYTQAHLMGNDGRLLCGTAIPEWATALFAPPLALGVCPRCQSRGKVIERKATLKQPTRGLVAAATAELLANGGMVNRIEQRVDMPGFPMRLVKHGDEEPETED